MRISPCLLARFSDSGQVQPAIVVDIDCRDSPSSNPLRFGNRDAFESRAADVLPQAETRRAPVREGQVHPTVLIEIDCDSAGRRRWKDRVPRLRRPKRALAWIAKDESGAPPSSQDKVDGAIVVEIGCHGSNTWRVTRESRLLRCVRERSIAVVAPHLIRRRVRRKRKIELAVRPKCKVCKARHIKIEVAIVVVVDERETERNAGHANAERRCHIAKRAVALIAVNRDPIRKSDSDIIAAIVVVIAGRAAESILRDVQPRRDVTSVKRPPELRYSMARRTPPSSNRSGRPSASKSVKQAPEPSSGRRRFD